MFSHNIDGKFTLAALDISTGMVQIKAGNKTLNEKFGGTFPQRGSLIQYEYVPAASIQAALTEVAARHLSKQLHAPVAAILERVPPVKILHFS